MGCGTDLKWAAAQLLPPLLPVWVSGSSPFPLRFPSPTHTPRCSCRPSPPAWGWGRWRRVSGPTQTSTHRRSLPTERNRPRCKVSRPFLSHSEETKPTGSAWRSHLPWCLAMALLITALSPLCGRLICRWCANLWQKICWGWRGESEGSVVSFFSGRTMTHRTIFLPNHWFLWVYGAFWRWAKVILNYCPSEETMGANRCSTVTGEPYGDTQGHDSAGNMLRTK